MGIISGDDAGPQRALIKQEIVMISKIYWDIFQALFGETK
jgi:hypothetical protein